MATIDISVVNLALPSLRDTFGIDLAQVEWVVLTYLLTVTSLLLTVGRLADLIGRTRLYNLGFVVFTFGSILCGAAPTLLTLVLFRIIQAVGASMLVSSVGKLGSPMHARVIGYLFPELLRSARSRNRRSASRRKRGRQPISGAWPEGGMRRIRPF